MSKVIMKGLLALFALTVWFVGQTPAYAADKGQTYVVVVGIDQFKDPQILSRKHAEADAKMLYDVFVNPQYFALPPERVKLLLGTDDPQRKSQKATKDNILAALTWVSGVAKKDDLVILTYIGEGGIVGERTCYFTIDSTFKDRAKTAINAGDMENVLDKLECANFCAFVDVNFKGFDAGKDKVGDPDLAKFYRELMGKDEEGDPTQSRIIFMPNGGLKPSLDLADHGIFAKVVGDGLMGKADSFGYEADGAITADELVKYVSKELPILARANGNTAEEKAQKPMILEGHIHDFVLEQAAAVTATNQKRVDQFDKIAKDSNFAKAITDEGRNLLLRMPKLEAQQEMRKAYQKLADGALTAEQFGKQRESIVAKMKLPVGPAAEYARHVIAATDMVMFFYYKKMVETELVDAAIRGLFKKLDEPIPGDIKEKLDNVGKLNRQALEALLTEARLYLGKREDLANGKDVTLSLHPLMGKLDRHSDYVDPEAVAKFTQSLEGRFSGIGVQIRKNNTRDELQVITPLLGSPAYNAKIYAGDIITHVIREVDEEGKPLAKPETIATKGMPMDEVVKKILGKEGTKVKVIVEREGEAKPLEFNLVRGSVEMETVLGHKRGADDHWDYVIDPENQICYVRLTGFQENTGAELEQLMRKLYKSGVRGFILDLRFNPGGLLDQAVKIADLFIDDGMIVTIKPRQGPETSYVGKSEGSYTMFPMVCLVNGHSASASEIVAACLQDHGRAVIIGSRSYGKGSVQRILPFPGAGGRLKVTTATFWRPSNRNLNKSSTSGSDEEDWGVIPNKGYDISLSVKELNDLQDAQRDREIIHRPGKAPEVNSSFQDRQLDSALEYLRGQIKMTTAKGGAKKAG